jgi:hypothetical protein
LVVAGAAVALSLGLGRTGLPGAPAPPSSAALKLHAVSQATGAEASMQVDKKRWGTEVTLQVTHVKGPVTCRLFAISKDGGSEAVMGWTVPADGYGTTVQPTPLILRGGTYIQTADITRYEVRTLDGGLLVSVPA